jgi:hypothetical protein
MEENMEVDMDKSIAALALLANRSDAFINLCNLYITVVLATVGFMASASQLLTRVHTVLIAVVFVAFAYGNWTGISQLSDQRAVLYADLAGKGWLGSQPELYKPSSGLEVSILHAVFDVLIVGGILLLGLRRPAS